ncbi:YaiI/YqxD family protein [Stieleria sp. ICT_E10.1]|uniref:YaiI/YqxD family protein n=1 Tax=Stieleria sedimenti TaxID=2976331 RepID=UPI002180005C|nr:YaiI/YqxD family protein [Stieleria sedimenti]MCS7465592.1 YaiI/YqxD family protein [Stieleria sedimenti]
MKIWIDADAAPRDVKEVVFRAAARLEIETVLVANSAQPIPRSAVTVRSVIVRQGANVADEYIVVHSQPGDLAVTADIPLAAQLVDKKVAVIDPRGDEYNDSNIAARLSMRDFLDELRGTGAATGGAAPYNAKDKKAFAASFDRLLTKLVKQADQFK